ncbi:MAG TPA: fatty acid desaturase [Thermoanaerobaculia bacterium]|jgi:beta-carotene hydroxylase|nr:fatty acid desaturase [Thermoanaerobaculia bacterium]
MSNRPRDLPSLDALGRDLLEVSRWRKAWSLVLPFALTASFFAFGARGRWLAALACPVLLSFLTYASTSHDLVHRNLRLPAWLNEILLSAVELITFRSGHAYRAVHLHHHAHFPASDDIEGSAAGMPWYRALLSGVTLQVRLWIFALRQPGPHRLWVRAEVTLVAVFATGCLALLPWTPLPALYLGLMVAGSWIYPFMTAYLVHDPDGAGELTQTRLFRGRLFSLVALEHLYHLEHHLYPQVPHHNWPRLARRLDPYFESRGLSPIQLLF